MTCPSICCAFPLLAGVLALASEADAQRVAGRRMPRRSPLIASISLDFGTEDDLVTPLSNGQSISTPGEFGRLVSISSTGPNAGPAIFDSAPAGPNDPCQDLDLLVGLGNVLILQNSLVPGQTNAGFFDRPNDDQDGGELVFDFATPVEPVSILLIDIDSGAQQGSSVTLADESGRTRVYSVPQRWTRDLVANGAPSFGSLSLQSLDPQPGFLSTATATQHPAFDSVRVVRMVVRLGSSGAMDDLAWRPGRSLGMVGDDTGKRVVVFDADLDQVLVSVPLPVAADSGLVGDCVIDARRSLGYVTDFIGHVWVIDLAHAPPELAAGINPILVSNPGEDLSLSPDGRFLAVSDGSSAAPLSIVELATRTEVGTVFPDSDCNSVDFCSNDSLVGTSFNLDQIMSFALAGDGTPALTGDVLGLSLPNNVACAPGGRAGVGLSRFPSQLSSFLVEGLVQGPTRNQPSQGLSACFAPDGQRLFVRQFGLVLAWSFAPLDGSLGAAPLYSFPVEGLNFFFGMDQIAVHPDGSRLYVPVGSAIRIHDPANGALLGSIPIPGALSPTGVAVERGLK